MVSPVQPTIDKTCRANVCHYVSNQDNYDNNDNLKLSRFSRGGILDPLFHDNTILGHLFVKHRTFSSLRLGVLTTRKRILREIPDKKMPLSCPLSVHHGCTVLLSNWGMSIMAVILLKYCHPFCTLLYTWQCFDLNNVMCFSLASY